MHTTNLRKVGGSVMLIVPPAFLEQLHLEPGTKVGISVEHGNLVINPKLKPSYTLDELLAASDYNQEPSQEDREWVDAPAVGKELI